ncbi:MAG: phosphatase PAP2 family protein [Gaiellaceae bacterium]|jgi:membrane-associated phospholipid phosphatase
MAPCAAVAERHQVLPRGWRDLLLQLGIWFGFILAYQIPRGIADRSPAVAFHNGREVIDFESRVTGLWELTIQSWTQSSHMLGLMVSWTYWVSQFGVVGLALLWVYLRRYEHFIRFRNVLILSNILGLVGYALLPTAPPRMFPELGFVDTLASLGTPNHGSWLVEVTANPYAAMPSLHAADALLVGVVLACLVKPLWLKALWLLWPAWVWFAVMATANHFWLDIAAGVLVASIAATIIYRRPLLRALGPVPA